MIRMPRALLLALITLSAAGPGAYGADPNPLTGEITAISSKVFNGYARGSLADGSLRPERYGFAIGGDISRLVPGLQEPLIVATRDDSIDKISFAAISRKIQGPLAAQKYQPTGDPKEAELLIVVFWGRSVGSGGFAQSDMGLNDGADQDLVDAQNARLMGFDSTHLFDQGFNDPSNMMSNIRKQVYSRDLDAIKEDRYYVILQAFDFQAAWKQRKIKLLWETRFSLSERRHNFGKALPGMAQAASEYFGQDSRGLITRPIPYGQVDVGDVKSLGPVPEK